MKKNVALKILVLAFCCIASTFITKGIIKADVIWQPENDDFFQENASDCKYVNREYTVICDELIAYENPFSDVEVDRFVAGDVLTIGYSYSGILYDDEEGTATESGLWGIISGSDNKWVRMDDLELIYDHQSFCEEHSDEFLTYDDSLKEREDVSQIVLWKYPNSGIVSSIINLEQWGMNIKDIYCDYLYTDENGMTWTYVPYIFCQKGWICIDNPESTELTVQPLPEPTEDPIVTETPGDVVVAFKTVNTWTGGFMGQIDITNNSVQDIEDWKLYFDCKNTIESLWSGTLLEQADEKVSVKAPDWDSVIKAGETHTVNFTAAGDLEEEPSNFVVK